MPDPSPGPGARTRIVTALVVIALATVWSPAAPPAAAHCDPGTDSYFYGIASTCPYNQDAETVIDALNAQAGDDMVYVLIKDLRFHPEIINVSSGATVVMVYADTDNPQPHDPRSSGSTGDPGTDLAKPTPSAPGTCFSVTAPSDNGAEMTSLGDVYPVTFTFDGTELQKSRGFQSGQPVGDLTGAQSLRPCPSDTFSVLPGGGAILPYHCGVHGGVTTAERGMRAAIHIDTSTT